MDVKKLKHMRLL